MNNNPEKGEMLFEVHAFCGRCKRKIRIIDKVKTIIQAEDELKKAGWIETKQSGWLCPICKGTTTFLNSSD